MIQKLINWLSSAPNTIKKKDILETINGMMLSINNDTIPSLNTMISSNDPAINNSKALTAMHRLVKIKVKDNVDLLNKIAIIVSNIRKEQSNLIKIVDDNIHEYVTDKTITAKQGLILRLVSDTDTFINYTSSLLYYVLIENAKEDSALPNKSLAELDNGLSTYANRLNVFMNYSAYIKEINKVDDSINLDTHTAKNTAVADRLINKSSDALVNMPNIVNMPNKDGYTGSMIYGIRKWIADVQIKKYEATKHRRKLIEIKLMELKAIRDNKPSDAITKQVTYYENKLAKLEYDIKEFEESNLN